MFGGILWDLFLIALVCFAGFVFWKTRDRWAKPILEQCRRWGGAKATSMPEKPKVDLKNASASAHARLMDILAGSGIKEKHITRGFTEERWQDGAVWLESTVEIRRPSSFNEGHFLRRALIDVAENGLTLMKDNRDKGAWTVEFGDRVRVYQRFRFEKPSLP